MQRPVGWWPLQSIPREKEERAEHRHLEMEKLMFVITGFTGLRIALISALAEFDSLSAGELFLVGFTSIC